MMNWRYADFIRIFIYFYNTRNYILKGKNSFVFYIATISLDGKDIHGVLSPHQMVATSNIVFGHCQGNDLIIRIRKR